MPFLNINTDAAVSLTNKLEKMHRSALPVAIRQTLNNVARDMKTRSIISVSSSEFTIRQKNFFRVFTGFLPAKGFDAKTMKATVGIFPRGNKSASDLDKQEFGGSIKGRSFIPTDKARVGKSHSKKVSKAKALNRFKNSPRVAWGNKAKFNKVVSKLEKGQTVIYGNTLFLLERKTKNKTNPFKMTAIWTYKSGRSAEISRATHFMLKAALISRKKMLNLYRIEAERQINRLMRK